MNNGLKEDIEKKCSFQFVRSSGPGGQNVNKVNTKVVTKLNIENLQTISEIQKNRIRTKLKNRLNSEDEIVLHVQDTRTREKNRKIAVDRMKDLIEEALLIPKKRKATKPRRSVREKRLGLKKAHGDKKKLRSKVSPTGE